MSPSVKSFIGFTVWIGGAVVLLRPFGYALFIGVVAGGAALGEFAAFRTARNSSSPKPAPLVLRALANAVVAAAFIAGMFHLLVVAAETTGPQRSYASPLISTVFARALLCAYVAAFASMYLVRRWIAGRRGEAASNAPYEEE